MMTQEIHLVEKVINGDGTASMIAELCVYNNGVFSHHDSRSPFTFPDTMTDQEIIDSLILNEYSRYY
jgi:hypothetical protein